MFDEMSEHDHLSDRALTSKMLFPTALVLVSLPLCLSLGDSCASALPLHGGAGGVFYDWFLDSRYCWGTNNPLGASSSLPGFWFNYSLNYARSVTLYGGPTQIAYLWAQCVLSHKLE